MKLDNRYFAPGLMVIIGIATITVGIKSHDGMAKFICVLVGILEIMYGLDAIQRIKEFDKKSKKAENEIMEQIMEAIGNKVVVDDKPETKEVKVEKKPKVKVENKKVKNYKVKNYKVKKEKV